MGDVKPQAKADDSHDGRYTHPSAASPGLGASTPDHTDYPRWLYNAKGDGRQVATADEEAAAASDGFKAAPPAHKAKSQRGHVRLGVLGLVLALGLIGLATPLLAQTSVTQTTLAAALAAPTQGAPATSVLLTSAAGITAPTATAPGSVIYMDTEAMRVQALSGTTAQVQRGQLGTAGAAHAANVIVFAGPSSGTLASPFVSTDPTGVCVAASQPYTLSINTRTGSVWACTPSTVTVGTLGATVAVWSAWGFRPDFPAVPRANVAGNVSSTTGGYTIKITDYVVALTTTKTGTDTITGTAAPVTTFYLPSAVGLQGKVLVLKDESGGVGATTFINIMGTIDGLASSQLKTAYGSLTIYAGSGGWFTIGCSKAGCFN